MAVGVLVGVDVGNDVAVGVPVGVDVGIGGLVGVDVGAAASCTSTSSRDKRLQRQHCRPRYASLARWGRSVLWRWRATLHCPRHKQLEDGHPRIDDGSINGTLLHLKVYPATVMGPAQDRGVPPSILTCLREQLLIFGE